MSQLVQALIWSQNYTPLADRGGLSALVAALRRRMETMLRAQGDPRMEGRGHVFDAYKPSSGDGLCEKFMRGEPIETGWVNPTDFEKGPIKPPLGPS